MRFLKVSFGVLFLLFGAFSLHATHLVLVGDSTVTAQSGWGPGLERYLNETVEVTNTARGGRSSMSFREEGLWEKALALQGDYYLIQFGHNDEPGKPGRSTTLEEYRDYLTQYVEETRAIGAQPILITPLVRRQFRDRDDPHTITSSLVERATAMRAVAAELEVPLLELHDRSLVYCEELGRGGCHAFSPLKRGGGFDGTHLNPAGRLPFGRIVAEELRAAMPALAPLIRETPRNLWGYQEYAAVVAADGSGDFRTVQAAVNAAPTDATTEAPHRILILPGIYQEHVHVPADKRHFQLLGVPGEAERTVITFDRHLRTPIPGNEDGKTFATIDSATVLVEADDFRAEHLTIENTTSRERRVQALALYILSDRAVLRHCRLLGWQDTLRVEAPRDASARQYFHECYIEGHVDFIYGDATAVFFRCRIHVKADGYITAASTPEADAFGYVFQDCRITAGPEVERGFFLGRPWRPHAAVAFVRCHLPAELRAEGWDNWGRASNEETARYVEYDSSGPGARPAERVAWAQTLAEEAADAFKLDAVLRGSDDWEYDE